MNEAKIISWSEDDNKFLIEVPKFAGYMANGDTSEKALKNSEIIIAE